MERYLASHPLFFQEPSRNESVTGKLAVLNLPDGWSAEDNGYWVSYMPPRHTLADQGWKIHISAASDCCQEAVDLVAEECVSRRIPFKHVRSIDDYVLANAKNSHPGTSGKLLTVYPEEGSLEEVVELLSGALEGFDGPEILSDIPASGCVGLRYGAFRRIVNKDGDYSLFDEAGTLIKDERVPYVIVPDFVEVPKFISDLIDRMDEEPAVPFEVEGMLRSSNAGCVASGTYDGKAAVLKQGRAHAGYDPQLRSGKVRVGHEADILTWAESTNGRAPRLYARFDHEYNTFIICERLRGITLHEWKRPRLPIYEGTDEAWTAHARETVELCGDLVVMVEQLHASGIYHRDLHAKNILVDDDGKCSAVDFEEATTEATDVQGTSKAQGYYCGLPLTAEQSDWFGIRQVLQDLMFGSVAETMLNSHGVLSVWTRPWARAMLQSDEGLRDVLWRIERHLPLECRVEHVLGAQLPHERITVSDIETATEEIIDRTVASTGSASVFFEAFETESAGLAFGRSGHRLAMVNAPDREDYWQSRNDENLGLLAGGGGDLFVDALAGDVAGLIESLPDRPLIALSDYGAVYAGVSGLLLASMYALGPACRGGEVGGVRDTLYGHLDRVCDLVTAGERLPGDSLTTRENQLSRIDHGLFGGNQSLAWLIAAGRAFAGYSGTRALLAIDLLLRHELTHYESSSGRLMYNQVNRLLPYLATGSAGIGVVAACLGDERVPALDSSTVHELIAACDATYAINTGLFNGWVGLWYGANGLRSYAGLERRSVEEAVQHLEGRGLYENHRLVGFPCDGGYRFTTDLATGMSGIVHALRLGSQDNWSLFPTGIWRGTHADQH